MVQTISVVGLGFVGLPLALSFAGKGYRVSGLDVDNRKLASLREGKSYLPDISDEELGQAIATKRLSFHDDYSLLRQADAVIICVPTPLDAHRNPDLTNLRNAGIAMIPHLRKGQLVVLESSTYPGTTREVLKPLLEQGGLSVGDQLHLAYSPERIDPGNRDYPLTAIPKVVSGLTDACLQAVVSLYSTVFEKVVPVSSPEVAEMTKLLENAYRFINISFVNEMAMICDAMKLDLWEAVQAAQTKPYGYAAFYPGPGVGGHCIPVDPLYLQWKARMHGLNSAFIDMCEAQNRKMQQYIVSGIQKALSVPTLSGLRLLQLGVTYKKDVNDIRESGAIELLGLLAEERAHVSYYDPYVPLLELGDIRLVRAELSAERLGEYDAVVIATDHSSLPLQLILDHAPFVYDARGVTRGMSGRARIVRLGAGDAE